MNCHRCGDTMILKKFYDYGGYSWSWKCTRCGEIMDQIVPQNQEGIARSGYLPYHCDHPIEINSQKRR